MFCQDGIDGGIDAREEKADGKLTRCKGIDAVGNHLQQEEHACQEQSISERTEKP